MFGSILGRRGCLMRASPGLSGRRASGAARITSMQPLEPRRLLSTTLPRFDHIVVVVEENRDYNDILGTGPIPPVITPVVPPSTLLQAPYLRGLAKGGLNFTKAHGETHPSQPNYMVLFSGSTQGVTSDATPAAPFSAPSLGGQVLAAGMSFAGYSEDLPSVGFTGSTSGEYARKHAPWVSFTDVPPASNRPFSDFPSDDLAKLPTLSCVIPNQVHDMHSGSVFAADQWLQSNLGGYARWAPTHNSLLIVTWDEGRTQNHIPTIFFGPKLHHGKTSLPLNHFRMLRTIEGLLRLPPLAGAAGISPARAAFTKRKHPPAAAPAPVETAVNRSATLATSASSASLAIEMSRSPFAEQPIAAPPGLWSALETSLGAEAGS